VSLGDFEDKSILLSSNKKVKSRVRFSEDINDSSHTEEMENILNRRSSQQTDQKGKDNYDATDDQSPRKAKYFDLNDHDENDYEIKDQEVDQDLKLLDAFDQDEYD
jgi:hypothetical protein